MTNPQDLAARHLKAIRANGRANAHATFERAAARAKREGRADVVNVLNEEQRARDSAFDLAARAGSVIPSVLPSDR